MRALVVTNMYPSAGRPALGSFVRDQIWALRRIDGLDVQVHPGDGVHLLLLLAEGAGETAGVDHPTSVQV